MPSDKSQPDLPGDAAPPIVKAGPPPRKPSSKPPPLKGSLEWSLAHYKEIPNTSDGMSDEEWWEHCRRQLEHEVQSRERFQQEQFAKTPEGILQARRFN